MLNELVSMLILGTIALMAVMFLKDRFLTFKQAFSLMLIFSISLAFAQEVVAPIVADPTVPPAWLSDVIAYLYAIPKVGPIVVEVGKWVGLIAGVMTALSVAVTAILAIPQVLASISGADKLAAKFKAFNDKVQPYLKWASIFNVQKK